MENKSIVLIGFMGAGKTTIGEILAAKLKRSFIDVDEELEKEFQMPITQVFKELGENVFRAKEKEIIERLASEGNQVLSLGGGAFLQDETRSICLKSCMVVFLHISFDKWKGRMSSLISTRPILQGKSVDDMEELFKSRQEIYSNHHLKITVDDKDPETIANEVIEQSKEGENARKKTITIRGVTIGEGAPKICVSLMGKTPEALVNEAKYLQTLDLDLIEWRVDFFKDACDIGKVKASLKEIRDIIANIPLIFTFRSAKEGGETEVSLDYYLDLNKTIVETGLVDLIDVELFSGEKVVKALIESAHQKGVFVIVSNHDFKTTPPKEEILTRLLNAQEMGGDIPKIAVMPQSAGDVLALLDATNTMFEQFSNSPFITIAMSGLGVISRMSGEIFGSSITFGAGRNASAPGQVGVKELKEVLNLIHQNL